MIDTDNLLASICQYIDSDIKLRDLQADETSDQKDIIQAWADRDLAIKIYQSYRDKYFSKKD